ncbi:otoferlin-like [Thrips palmi]|uniref:Otoferlin-like n=1 Tax=Thrips palmi TaxID=161013 RepID=A0A6P9AG51_THRPL|nr:otoferlin-like [Thrips palmi]
MPVSRSRCQGQLELWVDVLARAAGTLPMPPAVPFAPPRPSSWELRVVVLEAASVVGTERLLLSKDKSSDVYVKGWMSGLEREAQSTDVHYACLSGEALWTWRMVFRFEHVWPENRVVAEGAQGRHPPRLHLAVMDYDTFTKDDVLGTLSLDLSRLPRGASFAANCRAPGKEARPTVNLFLARHATGWWPALLAPDVTKARAKGLGVSPHGHRESKPCYFHRFFFFFFFSPDSQGKLKLELTLLPGTEAARDPAGVGHDGPQALPKPQRPVEAFSMLRHPVMGLYHFVWRRHRRMLLWGLLLFLLVVFLLVAVYSLPGYIVKKAIGA